MPTPIITHCKSEHEFLEVASKKLLTLVNDTLTHHETCRIGLSGGSTPKNFYKKLSELHIPWDRITLIVIDERNVLISDPRSNYGMIRDTLISKIEIPEKQVIYFDPVLGYDSAVFSMEQKLLQLKRERAAQEFDRSSEVPLFDILILGAGPDGHIAGIFPDSEVDISSAISSQKGFLTAKTHTDVFEVHERMTCTMEALVSCGNAMLLLKEHEKAHLLNKIKIGDTSTTLGKFVKIVPTEVYFQE